MDELERFINEHEIKASAVAAIKQSDNMFVCCISKGAGFVAHGPLTYELVGAVLCWLNEATAELNAERRGL